MNRVLSCAVVLCAAAAWAHGALPQTLEVSVRPGHPDELTVGTSFGLLVSRDRGASWSYLCEEAIGYGAGQIPTSVTLPSGTTFTGSIFGLAQSKDQQCTWTAVPAFADVGARGLALTSAGLVASSGKFGVTNAVRVSADEGQTWQDTGQSSEVLFFTDVVAAPSQPSRVYGGAWWYEDGGTTFVLRSDTGGTGFTRTEVTTLVPVHGPLRILAVHPTKPDVVLLAVNDDPGNLSVLVRSGDGLSTFAVVQEEHQPFNSAAFSSDGALAFAASFEHLYRSADEGRTFAALNAPKRNACVGVAPGAYYACADNDLDGYVLGRGDPAAPGLTGVLRWKDIQGVLACPAGSSVAQKCGAVWPVVQASFPGFDGGLASDGGTPGTDGGTTPPVTPKGCGCGAPGPAGPVLAVLLAVLARRRSKKRDALRR
ncbi:MAG: hypothetical protein K1X89_08680 [Myxococcaceae bacterium]|nr:hypothetical protein [Myxococcaceae bacterium]